jgi:hypothetical protein
MGSSFGAFIGAKKGAAEIYGSNYYTLILHQSHCQL